MVCDDKWKVQLLNMMMFIGCLIGAALFGHLNDTMGRKKPLLLAQLACVVAVFVSAAAPPGGYWFMAVVRMVMGIAAAGQTQCVAVLCAEIAGKSRRGVSSAFSGMFWPTGEFVLVGLAYGVHNWRTFTIITGCLSLAGLLLWPSIPESARWLLSQGRQAEATAVVQRIAALNGTRAPPVPLRTMQARADPAAASWRRRRIGLLDVLRQPRLLVRTLVLVFTWFSLYIVSYGVNLGAGALPGSLYVTFTLLTVAELAAQLMTAVVADKAGRHVILSCGLLVSGAACLACASTTHTPARAALAVIGKYGCTVGMVVLGTFTTELFATPIRASAMGVLNEAGRLGSIVAPLMLMVGAQVRPGDAVYVPFLAFGLAALLAGLLTLVLPETLGAPMAENIDDMNQLQSLFSAKPWQQGPFATIKFLFRARAARAARMRRSGQHQSPTQQQPLPVTQDVQKLAQQQPVNSADNSSSNNIYVECAQLKQQHSGNGEASEPCSTAAAQQQQQQQQYFNANII
ncbi:major facilitator superfamily domain-containing protein [Scenedesmus sp. NREL 46B-D3]|nr:major facilitator superfamily domain-containing protein [Scenedesmus sp. NREL 46B-D3]